jgi:hypothetical protein
MTKPMHTEEKLSYVYVALEKLQGEIEELRQQVDLLSKRVTKAEMLLSENPTLELDLFPTKKLDE